MADITKSTQNSSVCKSYSFFFQEKITLWFRKGVGHSQPIGSTPGQLIQNRLSYSLYVHFYSPNSEFPNSFIHFVVGSYDRNRMKFPDDEQQLMDQVRQLRQRVVNDGRSESR